VVAGSNSVRSGPGIADPDRARPASHHPRSACDGGRPALCALCPDDRPEGALEGPAPARRVSLGSRGRRAGGRRLERPVLQWLDRAQGTRSSVLRLVGHAHARGDGAVGGPGGLGGEHTRGPALLGPLRGTTPRDDPEEPEGIEGELRRSVLEGYRHPSPVSADFLAPVRFAHFGVPKPLRMP